MTHNMSLQPVPFEKIKNGTKTVEMRLNDEKRRLIKVGDTIEFTNAADSNCTVRCIVTGLFPFDSFADLYRTLSLADCGYDASEIHSAKPEDMELYYTKDEQKKYGVLGIGIKVII